MTTTKTRKLFLHGLDSSGMGTKGRFFSKYHVDVERPDFDGTLGQRLDTLRQHVSGQDQLILVGSSFGGLMAACLASEMPERIKRLVLLAPALNFHEYRPPEEKIPPETLLVIGKNDVVTPPGLVIPAAEASFSNLQISLVDDDHLLHNSFVHLDWARLLV
jgi:alpha-beta hydrolase superfamily lysophospholipase